MKYFNKHDVMIFIEKKVVKKVHKMGSCCEGNKNILTVSTQINKVIFLIIIVLS